MSTINYELALLKIPVSEIAKSTAFYRDVLGFEELFAVEEYGWAQLKAGDLRLALYKPGMGGGDGKIGGSTGFNLSLLPERFDAVAEELQQRSVLVENRVHESADGGTFLEVSDPDGNTIQIMRVEGA